MPRYKTKKEEPQELTFEQINYVLDFARSLNSNSYFYNPFLSNEVLKNINMKPLYQDRDKVEQMVSNPKANEKGLRQLSQHFDNTQMPYKRLKHYYGGMPTFDWTIIPYNVTEEDMKSDKFKKEYDKVLDWLDKLNIKREFPRIARKIMLEDAFFAYIRESESGITLQEMPSDFCLIDAWSELGYLYSFNLLYFMQTGVDKDAFAPEFKKYYKNALDMKNNKTYHPNIRPEFRDGNWFYWQQINPDKGWVFKFNSDQAGITPPLSPLFVDSAELDTYKRLQKNKYMLEAYKMIIGLIPRNKDNKTGAKSDDFGITADTAAKFMQLVNSSLPEGVSFKALPFEDVKAFEFPNSENKNDIVGRSVQQFYYNSGTSQFLFASDKTNVAAIKASIKTDENFITQIYPQFETFVNYHLNKITSKKFKFRIKFEGTMFDQEERIDKYMKYAEHGMVLPQLGSALGLSPKEFNQSLSLMRSMGFVEKLEVLPTSATRSKEEGVGAPKKRDSDLTESGEITRGAGSNEMRE